MTSQNKEYEVGLDQQVESISLLSYKNCETKQVKILLHSTVS
jgi:hypothetical protein